MSILTSEMNSLCSILLWFDVSHATVILTEAKLSTYIFKDIFFYCVRARTLKALEVIFFRAYLYQEYQDKCSSAINDVEIDLLSKSCIFHKKRVHAHTFAEIHSKLKNACNIHNFKFACKKWQC